ncbi:unnamed protein product, partial [marine sediment metagenome]
MVKSGTRQSSAIPTFIEYSTALRFITGSTPGMPMHTGHVFV